MPTIKRTFTVVRVSPSKGAKSLSKRRLSKTGGVFRGTPAAAAKKVGSQVCRKSRGKCVVKVAIRETTQGSDKKVFKYSVTRKRLAQPMGLLLGGVPIVKHFKTEVKAIKSRRASTSRK